jgi:hypothetical protein
MNSTPKTYRPTRRETLEVVGLLVVMGGIVWLIHDQVLAAVVTLVFLVAYLAWYFWRRRYL